MLTSVVVASTLQIALAATFVVIAVVAYLYGRHAQLAAENEIINQGLPVAILEQHHVKFDESRAELMLPLAIAACLIVLAILNVQGSAIGRIITWIFQSILMTGGGFITARQVFAARYMESAFAKSRDTRARQIDVKALVSASMAAFPTWLPSLVLIRFALTTLGSAIVVLLLAMPAADAFFH